MLPDYHIHSNHSCDAHDSMMAICRSALSLGLNEIGFSEHLDFNPLDECAGYFDPGAYWSSMDECRAVFAEGLTLRAGLEVSEPDLYASNLMPMLEPYPWDYLLGSQHWIDDMNVFDPAYFDVAPGEAYGRYFDKVLGLVTAGDFDILAHMDIAKRYGYDAYGVFDPSPWEEQIRSILQELARRDKALEVNTGTLRRPVGETSPGPLILRWFRECGGRLVTFGSDAHLAAHVGFGQAQVVRQLEEAGFAEVARYERRQPQLLPLSGFEIEAE
jgi:histidinol-phosphatase (PHP family)